MTLLLFLALILALLGLIWWWHRERHARLLATVAVVTLPDFPSVHRRKPRPLHIYLPPGYQQSTRTYPTLYLNDGQDAAALKLRQTMATLIRRRQVAPFIVVAIPTGEERLQEYGTAVAANAQGLGQEAGAYARFVTAEVVPAIRQRFRVKPGAAHTAVWGASLGGLSAFDLAWNHPDIFGMVGVMSGSFWWRAAEAETAVPSGRRIAHSLVRRGPKRDGLRFWFEAATQDETHDRDNDGVIDAIQDTLELMDELAALGYERGREMVYVQVAGGRHHYHTWAQCLPHFLRWAFPA